MDKNQVFCFSLYGHFGKVCGAKNRTFANSLLPKEGINSSQVSESPPTSWATERKKYHNNYFLLTLSKESFYLILEGNFEALTYHNKINYRFWITQTFISTLNASKPIKISLLAKHRKDNKFININNLIKSTTALLLGTSATK